MTEEELIFHSGQKIEIKDGYKALVRFVKLEATPEQVCQMLIDFNIDKGRKGELRDIQRLASVAISNETGLDLSDDESDAEQETDDTRE